MSVGVGVASIARIAEAGVQEVRVRLGVGLRLGKSRGDEELGIKRWIILDAKQEINVTQLK